MGVRKKARSAALPLKRPRTSAMEARSPSSTEKKVTSKPIFADVRAASIQRGSAKSSSYQRSVQPGGGKMSQREEPKESAMMKMIGSRRKSATRRQMKPRPHFHAPSLLKVRSI